MLEPHARPSGIVRARERAARELVRAARATAIATRHEDLATHALPALRKLHVDMAEIHYAIERRHLTAASLHTAHADRLESSSAGVAPRFMAAVAATVGAPHVGVSLVLDDHTEAVTVGSDRVAAAAQDLEFSLGEGPVHDVTTAGRPLTVTAAALPERWPHLAPAIARLGVRAVAAVPLRAHARCLGALTVFDPPEEPMAHELRTVADALVHSALLAPEGADPLDVPLLAEFRDRAMVHQATGMVAVQVGCSAADGLAALRARAFVANESVIEIARDVVQGRLRLN